MKEKCFSNEKYFLEYLRTKIDFDSKPNLVEPPDPVLSSVPDLCTEKTLLDRFEKVDQKEVIEHTESDALKASATISNSESEPKYIRPNLMAYFTNDTTIELSDTDTDTNSESNTNENQIVLQLENNAENPDTYLKNTSEMNNHECPCCQQLFDNVFSYNNHVKDHDHKQCKVCGRVCNNTSNITLHFRTHSLEKPYKCPHCEYRTCTTGVLTTHISKKHNDGIHIVNENSTAYRCNTCSKYFFVLEQFRVHLHHDHEIIVSNNQEALTKATTVCKTEAFKCTICHRQLSNYSTLTIHMRLHQTDKLKYCYICNASFMKNMFLHFKQCHPGLPAYKCTDHCQQTFKTLKEFDTHKRTSKIFEITKDTVECYKNGTSSVSLGNYNNNKTISVRYSLPVGADRIKTDAFQLPIPPIGYAYRPMNQLEFDECCICDEKFESDIILNEHIKSHLSRKCKSCHRQFGNIRALIGHFKLKHPKEQAADVYECGKCGKAFEKFYSLKQHQKVHSKENKATDFQSVS